MANSQAGAQGKSITSALGLSIAFSATAAVLIGLPAQADQNQAIQKYNAKDYQGALNEFRDVATKDPKNALAHYYMALCDQCLARVDEAKKEYKWVVDNGPANLKGNAQAGLSQLDKVNVRTGGSGAVASTPAPAATTSGASKPGNDLIERSKDAPKDMAGKGTASGADKGAPTKTAVASGGNVAKVYNFFSESSRQSINMDPSWDEVKTKYPKMTFQKVTVGDPLCEKYGVTEFPTIVVVDKNGKALATQGGQQSTDSMCTTIDTCNK